MDVPEERFDDEWSEIVADLTAQGVGMVDPPQHPSSAPHSPAPGEGPPQAGTDPGGRSARVWWQVPPPATGQPPPPAAATWDDDEHFVPAPPPPLPAGSPVLRLAWLGVLGGPAVLLGCAMIGVQLPTAAAVAAGLSFLGGFATLVWLLPDHRDDESGNGAQI